MNVIQVGKHWARASVSAICKVQAWVMGPGKANSPLSGESPLPGPHQARLCSLLKYDGDGGPVVIHSVLSEGLESAREQRLT